jgi:hypothetical protein
MNPIREAAREIAPGLDLLRYSITEPGTKEVQALRMDLSRPDLSLRVGFAGGTVRHSRETVSGIARRYDAPRQPVLAAVNAAFFDEKGTPLGAIIDRGSLLKYFRGWRRAVFAWTSAYECLTGTGLSAAGSRITFLDRTSLPIDDINDPRRKNQMVLYTPEYGPSTATPPHGTEVTVRAANLPLSPRKEVIGTVSMVAGDAGNRRIPEDGFVLSATGNAAEAVLRHATVGDSVRVRLGFNDARWNAAEGMVTGAGLILRDGTAPVELWKRYNRNFRGLQPRTLAGWNDRFLYLVTVDGRRPGHSEGMTFPEMAEFMKETLGCRDAVNLDGGGSTTMVVEGRVVNQPSDGEERPVSNAILVVRDRETTPLPCIDRFDGPSRRPEWRDRFTMNGVEGFSPAAPGGDGRVLRVYDPAGGFETVRIGRRTDRNYSVSAWIYCDFRERPADEGYDTVALFARDAGDGAFDDPEAGSSNCYALAWDCHDGRLRAGSYREGKWKSAMQKDLFIPETNWHLFRINCRGNRISWYLDERRIAIIEDDSLPSGPCGIAYREWFADDRNIGGAVVESFIMEKPPP